MITFSFFRAECTSTGTQDFSSSEHGLSSPPFYLYFYAVRGSAHNLEPTAYSVNRQTGEEMVFLSLQWVSTEL